MIISGVVERWVYCVYPMKASLGVGICLLLMFLELLIKAREDSFLGQWEISIEKSIKSCHEQIASWYLFIVTV